ncbi:MAG: hypothetical protein S4CHLAM102_12700 [Chlamydiia bacterium]|nr:hypothetical protein [Chlamydiia bacterium]
MSESAAVLKTERGVVLVTGSAGRIGVEICKRLGELYQIVGFELASAIYASAHEELVPMDISSEESVLQAMLHIKQNYGNKIVACIHLAAYYSFNSPNYAPYEKITVQGTKRLLKALQQFEVELFMFTSTMLVHKACQPGEKINEVSPLDGNWAYPQSKIETEAVICSERGNIPVAILRVSGVYDDQCSSIPISQQMSRIYEHQLAAHLFPGNKTHGACFMHMDDLVDAMCLVVEKRKELPAETILEIGEEEVLSFQQMQDMISMGLFNKKIATFRIPKFIARMGAWIQNHIPFFPKPFIKSWMVPLADEHFDLDITKAKTLLGWQPKHKLADELPKMIQQLKDDPLKFYEHNHLPLHYVKKQLKHKK